jgi:hypothetical protein
VHHAHPAANQENVERVLSRVPRHLPAHEVAVRGALFVRPWQNTAKVTSRE